MRRWRWTESVPNSSLAANSEIYSEFVEMRHKTLSMGAHKWPIFKQMRHMPKR
jgi:hypothetical protein